MIFRVLAAAAAGLILAAPAQAAGKFGRVGGAAQTSGTPPYTQDFTDSGVFGGDAPVFAYCQFADGTATDTSVNPYRWSAGVSDGTREGSLSVRVGNNAGNSLGSYASYNNRGLVHVDSAGNVDAYANITFITNGVRLTWQDAPPAAWLIECLAGSGDVEAGVWNLTSNNGTSAQSVTHNLTGTPDLILTFTAGQGANTDSQTNVTIGAGFWTSGAEVGFTQSVASAVATNQASARMISATAINKQVTNSTNLTYTGNISNVGSSTFDVTFSAAHTNHSFGLALRGINGATLYAQAGTFTSKTTTGTNADITGMSGAPQAVLMIASQLTALDTGSTGAAAEGWSYGMAAKGSGTTQYGTTSGLTDDDASSADTAFWSQVSTTKLFRTLNTSGATLNSATVSSWDSGGLTPNHDTVDGTAYEVAYLAFGSQESTPSYTAAPSSGTMSRTTSSMTFPATVSVTGTRYGALLTDGSSAPTCDQLEAQTATGGLQYASQATTATVSSDLVLSGITTGTVKDYYECTESAGGVDSSVQSVGNVYKTPAWTDAPAVASDTDTQVTISKTLDGAGTVFVTACPPGLGTPSFAQMNAQEFCADGTTEPLGVATDDAGGSVAVSCSPLPICDIFVAGTYGSLESAVTAITSELLDPSDGYQFTTLASISSTSLCARLNVTITPDIAANDIIELSLETIPSGFDLVVDTDCDTAYLDEEASQQYAWLNRVYDASVRANMTGGPTKVWFNNPPPDCNPDSYDTGVDLVQDVAATTVNLKALCVDPNADTLTCGSSDTGTGTGADKRPAGMTVTDGSFAGTPTTPGSGSFTVTCSDENGGSDTVDVSWTVLATPLMPDCDGFTMLACVDAIFVANLNPVVTFASSSTVAAGYVMSQDELPGTALPVGDTVGIVVSRGAGGRVYKRLSLSTQLGM